MFYVSSKIIWNKASQYATIKHELLKILTMGCRICLLCDKKPHNISWDRTELSLVREKKQF